VFISQMIIEVCSYQKSWYKIMSKAWSHYCRWSKIKHTAAANFGFSSFFCKMNY